ncbi:MAG: LanC-like protein [Gaiella sp.]|nr:LanC-like protein [Gaiella sp.]
MGIAELVDPHAHEPLTETAWDEQRARSAIAAIVAETEAAFDPDELWPAHPLDEEPEEPPLRRVASLYLGAAGVIWALHALGRPRLAVLRRDWAAIATALPDRYRAEPDFPEVGVVPSLWMGEAGILLVAHTLAPAAWQGDELLDAVRANVDHPSLELMWGSPGTMLAAQVMYERTGDERWRDAWEESASLLWEHWRDELWEQDLYGHRAHILGPAHGLAGNTFVLARGDLLDGNRRAELDRRVVATLERHALRADGLAQWPPSLEPSSAPRRTQWCHGAPGIVASLASLAPADDELTALLVAGGELVWRAGPLRKGASLCHGTAGNGYAFLKLHERTGDGLWLDRARSFAMHAIEQVERATAEHGRGRHTLWTGDPGTALYLAGCLAADASFPTLDRW